MSTPKYTDRDDGRPQYSSLGNAWDSEGAYHRPQKHDTIYFLPDPAAKTHGSKNGGTKYDPYKGILWAIGTLRWDTQQLMWVEPHQLTNISEFTSTNYITFKERNPMSLTLNVNRQELINQLTDHITEVEDEKKDAVAEYEKTMKERHKNELKDFKANPGNFITFRRDTTALRKDLRNLKLATDETIEMTEEDLNRLLNGHTV